MSRARASAFAALLLFVGGSAPGCSHLPWQHASCCPPVVQHFVCDDYCRKPLPCSCVALTPTCECYCPKPPPCSCLHLLFCCDEYCPKPPPCCPEPSPPPACCPVK